MVRINGENIEAAGKTIADYLKEAGYNSTRVAVEQNENIVPKSEYETVVMKDGDVIEVVNFTGGG